MTVKLIGAVMIFIACAYFGIRKSTELKGRCTSLRNLETAMGYLETEISFSANNLKRAFENINKSTDTRSLFGDAAKMIEEFGIKKAWGYAVMKNTMPILNSDKELLLMLGTKLGKTDMQNQLKHIGYIKTLLNAQGTVAENEYARLGKIYRSGGVLVGLFIILVII